MPVLSFFVLLLCLAACSAEPVSDLAFDAAGGEPVVLYRRPAAEPGRQTLLDAGEAVSFLPARPAKAPAAAPALSLLFEGATAGLVLEILKDENSVASAHALPDGGGRRVQLVAALPEGRFGGLRFSRSKDGPAGRSDAPVRLVRIGYSGSWTGLIVEPGLLAQAGRLEVSKTAGGSAVIAWPPSPSRRGSLSLVYQSDLLAPDARIELSAGASRRAFRVSRRAGEAAVYLYDAGLGFAAERLELRGFEAALKRVLVREAEPASPLPIDLGGLLEYPSSAWRRSDFELFRWNLFPDILILDSLDLAYQERMFSRLAFFLEKRGFRGRLLSNRELEGRHGWNAHNYDPAGLAAFFNKARETKFPLNREELVLRELLIGEKILTGKNGPLLPGQGGILAISRESGDSHRRLLLTHEAWHGVYYGDAGLRELARKLWTGLEPEERGFWLFFFSWMNYDVGNQALLINEYQAYLLQQDLRLVDHYFKTRVLERIGEQYPDYKAKFEKLFEERPDMLSKPARVLDGYVRGRLGFEAGQLFCLWPEKP